MIMTFQSEQPIYPLALTSTIGTETEILLYVLSTRKWLCDSRLPIRFSGEMTGETLFAYVEQECPELYEQWQGRYNYLCRFKNRLTPEQMREDLIFRPAFSDDHYRDHIITW